MALAHHDTNHEHRRLAVHGILGHGRHRVLVLHGWFGDGSSFSPLWPHLDVSAYTYAFLDCRGYGTRRGVHGKHTMDEIAGDALATADHLDWHEFSLIGHSMGGMAIQKLYAMAPDRIQRMVGVSPVPASGVPFDDQTWKLFADAARNPADRRTIIDLTTGNRLTDVWLDAMVRRSVDCSYSDAVAAYLGAWARSDFHDDIEGSAVPIKAIVGEHDPALTAEVMRATFGAWYPHFELVEMSNAGHYSINEVPIALAGEIERFLAA